MSTIRVFMMGFNTPHAPDHVHDHPNGSGKYVFMHFTTDFTILTEDGTENGSPDDCTLMAPHFPQWHRGIDGHPFRNNWFYLDGPSVAQLAKRYKIPLNRLFRPRDTSSIVPIMEAIQRESIRQEPFWEDAVTTKVTELLLSLGRHKQAADAKGRVNAAYLERFLDARLTIHTAFQERWTVARMAELVALSESRFAVLYAQFFGVSPVEDLIRVRLDHAKFLLRYRGATVAEAAAGSGIPNVYYFSRLFRRRIGCPPRDYYRQRGREVDSH